MFQSFLVSPRMKQVIKKLSGKHLRFLQNQLSVNEKPFVMPTSADEELLLWFKTNDDQPKKSYHMKGLMKTINGGIEIPWQRS